jgi:hypothetical protein
MTGPEEMTGSEEKNLGPVQCFRHGSRPALLALIALVASTPGLARVTRVTVLSIAPVPAAAGAPAYEILRGRFAGELDPRDPHNRIITDLGLAPRNARGRVDYSATFQLARPVEVARASGVLLYDVPNRGRGRVAPDPDGHVRVVSGWQGDIPPAPDLETATVPIATRRGGRPLTGPVLARFENVAAGTRSATIGGGLGSPVPRPRPVSLDPRRARLVREDRPGAAPVAIDPEAWAFADCRTRPFPGVPDPQQLCLRDGFDPHAAYTLVYEGRDPPVLGIGFAATRDFVAFLRSGRPDDAGKANPVGAVPRWTVATGTSQSGNFLRSFVHLGFNEDEAGARVFDGINPNIAARHVPLNLRFGVPGGAAGAYEAGSEGRLWWARVEDRARRRGAGGLLDRCRATRSCPKVVETLGSAEFWGLRASPGFVGTDARRDLPLPDDVRRYYFPGVTHGGARTTGFAPAGEPTFGGCALPGNPNPSAASLRVAQRHLIAWVRDGTPPPPSRYPTLAAGELVAPTAGALGWPAIPGVPVPDGKLNPFIEQDFGRGFDDDDVSGVSTRQPPTIRRTLPSLVPRLDADGNETSGIRSVQLQVPLGTYLGWNVATRGFGRGGGCGFEGGFVPFARTRAEREGRGDPRPSLEERYGDHAGFLRRVREAVERQQAEGWLLPDDAAAILSQAAGSDVLR